MTAGFGSVGAGGAKNGSGGGEIESAAWKVNILAKRSFTPQCVAKKVNLSVTTNNCV